MAIELRRKSDDSLVKAGDKLKTNLGVTEFTVREILGPSFKFGAAPIVTTEGAIILPSQCGCYVTTV